MVYQELQRVENFAWPPDFELGDAAAPLTVKAAAQPQAVTMVT